jgi:hypothetical protein
MSVIGGFMQRVIEVLTLKTRFRVFDVFTSTETNRLQHTNATKHFRLSLLH